MKKRLLIALACSSLLLSGCSFEFPGFNGGGNNQNNQQQEIIKVSGVDIESKPNKLIYTVNEDVDLTGLVLKVSYEDTTAKLVTYSSNDNSISLHPLANGEKYTASTGIKNVNLKYQENNQTFFLSYQITVGGGIVPATQYTISFDANGGNGTMAPVTVDKNTNYTLPECGFTAPSNKEFKNWSINNFTYNPGISITIVNDIIVKAIWKDIVTPINQYTISFDKNGGTGTMTEVKVNAGSKYTLPSCTFTAPSGKEFKAWQIGTNTTERAVGYQFVVTSNTVIKALWKDIPVQTTDEWTIMLYLCGNDLESGKTNGQYNSLATEDISEILSVSGQPSDVNFIIQTGGAKHWSRSDIPTNRIGRYYVQNRQLKKDATDSTLTDVSMGATSTFQSFLEWGLTKYPAKKTGVILWNHGGALDGVCYDENHKDSDGYEDSLTDDEVVSALKGAFNKVGRTEKLEFIGYDACLMQVQDIAEFNSPYFNYMVGSEESEAGEGWQYNSWVDDLYAKKDTTVILKAICDGFVDSFESKYGSQYDNDQTQSYLDLSKMADYKTAFENLASQIRSIYNQKSANRTAFKNMMKEVKCYADTYCDEEDYQDYTENYGYPEEWFDDVGEGYYLLHGYHLHATFDVYDFLTKLSSDSTYKTLASSASNVKSALSSVVKYNRAGDEAGESHGLSLVCPMNNYTDYSSSHTHFSTWRSIVG